MKVKDCILLVEDNEKIVLNIKMLLEFNNYEVFTAENGKIALNLLQNMSNPPDLIISDIMMPEMNGYDFFQYVSENPLWISIPFIFLSAKATPEDIRLGKKLGADDYITKPFDGDELIAIIIGKIKKSKKNREMSKKLEKKLLEELMNIKKPTLSESELKSVFIFYVVWDESFGPKLKNAYPDVSSTSFDLQQISTQLFQATVSLYGYGEFQEAQGILLRIANIEKDGYIYFDSIMDIDVRGDYRQFMLAILAPHINYIESLRIREYFHEIANQIKTQSQWELEFYWQKLIEILA